MTMPGLFLVAAAALIVRDDGCLLLMRRSALKDFAAGEWETPNGRLEPGESVLAALHREVMEETGLTIEPLRPVDTWRVVRGPDNQEMIGITYLCRQRGASNVRLSDEHDAFQWVRPEDVSEFPVAAVFRDALLRILNGVGRGEPQPRRQ
jgi:8-oxo-dGTP diphosphatase